MIQYLTIVRIDFLQRTRTYGFLLVVAISLYAAYTFVPPLDASYSTIRFGNNVGNYNSTWLGFTTAIMASVFLSLTGFFLVNNSLTKDLETRVGEIIASTRISNISYLLSKVLSNFMVLLVIAVLTFMMSILLFFLYGTGYEFEFVQFVLPYIVITLPTLFLTSCVAVVFEIFFMKKSVLSNLIFFVLFISLLINSSNSNTLYLDVFGIEHVTSQVTEILHNNGQFENIGLNIGFQVHEGKTNVYFECTNLSFSFAYILTRFLWMFLALLLVALSSIFFNRFSSKVKKKTKGKSVILTNKGLNDLVVDQLPETIVDYKISPLIITEIKLFIRKGAKWLWVINIIGALSLLFTPIEIAHKMILPILWLFQIHRWSDLVTKEKYNRVHYFTSVSYKPLSRLLLSQMISGVLLSFVLALPLIIRYLFQLNAVAVVSIILGSIFIVLLATFTGIMTGSKKVFEIVFIVLTYMNINHIPFVDYFGASQQSSSLLFVLALNIFMLLISLSKRKYDLKYL